MIDWPNAIFVSGRIGRSDREMDGTTDLVNGFTQFWTGWRGVIRAAADCLRHRPG